MTDALSFRNIGVDGLRKFLQDHAEKDYELVDVRERDEYQERHLPGARLLPLSELEGRVNELREDKHTILYCGSGKRSERAALMVAQHRTIPNLYSLAGGVTAWDGETLPDFPNLHVFDVTGSPEQVVLRAMDLEKGAERLYEMLLGFFEESAVSGSMKKLLAAEEAHARLLYGLLKKVSTLPPDPFDALYGSMKGDLLESGETYEQVSKRVRDIPAEKRWALLELALDMEFRAYDLYRNLAAVHPGTELEDVVLKLAAQEKLHYRMVLDALGVLAAERAAKG
jgi:rhodanese-related sulfurtransferase